MDEILSYLKTSKRNSIQIFHVSEDLNIEINTTIHLCNLLAQKQYIKSIGTTYEEYENLIIIQPSGIHALNKRKLKVTKENLITKNKSKINAKEYIEKLLEKGDTKKAISECLDRVKFLMSDGNKNFLNEHKKLVLFSSRINQIFEHKIQGTLSNQDISLQTNQITNNFIEWLGELEEAFWTEKTIQVPNLLDLVFNPTTVEDDLINTYRFRAEVDTDVNNFVKLMKGNIHSIIRVRGSFPDVVVEFQSNLELEEIKEIMKTIEDGHVMFQSLNYKNKYTGERIFDL